MIRGVMIGTMEDLDRLSRRHGARASVAGVIRREASMNRNGMARCVWCGIRVRTVDGEVPPSWVERPWCGRHLCQDCFERLCALPKAEARRRLNRVTHLPTLGASCEA